MVRTRFDFESTYQWIGEGTRRGVSGHRLYYEGLRLRETGEVVSRLDTVEIVSGMDGDQPEEPFVAQVLDMWEELRTGTYKYNARWFFRPSDIPPDILKTLEALPGGPAAPNELFLSNSTDLNEARSIIGPVQVRPLRAINDEAAAADGGAGGDGSDPAGLTSGGSGHYILRYGYTPSEEAFTQLSKEDSASIFGFIFCPPVLAAEEGAHGTAGQGHAGAAPAVAPTAAASTAASIAAEGLSNVRVAAGCGADVKDDVAATDIRKFDGAIGVATNDALAAASSASGNDAGSGGGDGSEKEAMEHGGAVNGSDGTAMAIEREATADESQAPAGGEARAAASAAADSHDPAATKGGGEGDGSDNGGGTGGKSECGREIAEAPEAEAEIESEADAEPDGASDANHDSVQGLELEPVDGEIAAHAPNIAQPEASGSASGSPAAGGNSGGEGGSEGGDSDGEDALIFEQDMRDEEGGSGPDTSEAMEVEGTMTTLAGLPVGAKRLLEGEGRVALHVSADRGPEPPAKRQRGVPEAVGGGSGDRWTGEGDIAGGGAAAAASDVEGATEAASSATMAAPGSSAPSEASSTAPSSRARRVSRQKKYPGYVDTGSGIEFEEKGGDVILAASGSLARTVVAAGRAGFSGSGSESGGSGSSGGGGSGSGHGGVAGRRGGRNKGSGGRVKGSGRPMTPQGELAGWTQRHSGSSGSGGGEEEPGSGPLPGRAAAASSSISAPTMASMLARNTAHLLRGNRSLLVPYNNSIRVGSQFQANVPALLCQSHANPSRGGASAMDIMLPDTASANAPVRPVSREGKRSTEREERMRAGVGLVWQPPPPPPPPNAVGAAAAAADAAAELDAYLQVAAMAAREQQLRPGTPVTLFSRWRWRFVWAIVVAPPGAGGSDPSTIEVASRDDASARVPLTDVRPPSSEEVALELLQAVGGNVALATAELSALAPVLFRVPLWDLGQSCVLCNAMAAATADSSQLELDVAAAAATLKRALPEVVNFCTRYLLAVEPFEPPPTRPHPAAVSVLQRARQQAASLNTEFRVVPVPQRAGAVAATADNGGVEQMPLLPFMSTKRVLSPLVTSPVSPPQGLPASAAASVVGPVGPAAGQRNAWYQQPQQQTLQHQQPQPQQLQQQQQQPQQPLPPRQHNLGSLGDDMRVRTQAAATRWTPMSQYHRTVNGPGMAAEDKQPQPSPPQQQQPQPQSGRYMVAARRTIPFSYDAAAAAATGGGGRAGSDLGSGAAAAIGPRNGGAVAASYADAHQQQQQQQQQQPSALLAQAAAAAAAVASGSHWYGAPAGVPRGGWMPTRGPPRSLATAVRTAPAASIKPPGGSGGTLAAAATGGAGAVVAVRRAAAPLDAVLADSLPDSGGRRSSAAKLGGADAQGSSLPSANSSSAQSSVGSVAAQRRNNGSDSPPAWHRFLDRVAAYDVTAHTALLRQLFMFQRGEVSLEAVIRTAQWCLAGAPQLLEEFQVYLPASSRGDATSGDSGESGAGGGGGAAGGGSNSDPIVVDQLVIDGITGAVRRPT